MKTAFLLFAFESVWGAPQFFFMDNTNEEYKEIQTTAVPDLPAFLFKHFGQPPLTDNQILELLIGSTAIPEGLMTHALLPTEQTTVGAMFDLEDDSDEVEKRKNNQLEIELIEMEKELKDDTDEIKELKNKILGKIVLDEKVLDRIVLNEKVLDDIVSDEKILDEKILDKKISQKNVLDKVVLDENSVKSNSTETNFAETINVRIESSSHAVTLTSSLGIVLGVLVALL